MKRVTPKNLTLMRVRMDGKTTKVEKAVLVKAVVSLRAKKRVS